MDGSDPNDEPGEYVDGEHPSCVEDDAGDGPCNDEPTALEVLAAAEPSLAGLTVNTELPDGRKQALRRNPDLAPNKRGWGMAVQEEVGVPDGNGLFQDDLFKALRIGKVRRTVPWDVALRMQRTTACDSATTDMPAERWNANKAEYEKTERFVNAAAAAGLDVTISFEHCKNNQEYCVLPTKAEYNEAVHEFRTRFPTVTDYTAWNEPNVGGYQPTSRACRVARGAPEYSGAVQAAHFWRNLRRACRIPEDQSGLPACRAAAGDFSDGGDFTREYFKQYKKAAGGRRPWLSAFHPYATRALDRVARRDAGHARAARSPATKSLEAVR